MAGEGLGAADEGSVQSSTRLVGGGRDERRRIRQERQRSHRPCRAPITRPLGLRGVAHRQVEDLDAPVHQAGGREHVVARDRDGDDARRERRMVTSGLPSATFQTRTVLSAEPEMTLVPSRERARPSTASPWPE